MKSILSKLFGKRYGELPELDKGNVPAHVAIIMDGNGRWAKKRGLPRSFGHRQGSENLREIVRTAGNIGVKMLTVYAFSTENWKRPSDEVEYLMTLFSEYLDRELPELDKNNVRLRFSGDTEVFSEEIRKKIDYDREYLSKNSGLIFNFAVNYGGRAEITRAAKNIAAAATAGKISVSDIDEELFSGYTYTPDYPEVDLLIRTSVDYRISNFLLWQIAYAEMVFIDTYFPDFVPEKFLGVIAEYQRRHRRFGGL